jgi:hypothetical protein
MAFKRLKNWFFTATSVLRDDLTMGGVRLLKSDQPTESTMRDLLESSTFSTESDDRAKVTTGEDITLGTEQGLVVLATDSQVKSHQAQLSDRSLVVQPHQTPDIANGAVAQVPDGSWFPGYNAETIDVTIDPSTTTRNRFLVRIADNYSYWLANVHAMIGILFDGINTMVASIQNRLDTLEAKFFVPSGGTVRQVLTKVDSVPGNATWQDPISGFKGTSGSTVLVGTGSKLFNIGNGFSFDSNIPLKVKAYRTSDPTVYMEGSVTSYATGLLTLNIVNAVGGGSYNDWTISISDVASTGDKYHATSSTSVTLGSGVYAFNIGLGYDYSTYLNTRVKAYSASAPGNYLDGVVTDYTAGVLSISPYVIGGTGTYTDWVIGLSAGLLTGSTTSTSGIVATAPTGGSVSSHFCTWSKKEGTIIINISTNLFFSGTGPLSATIPLPIALNSTGVMDRYPCMVYYSGAGVTTPGPLAGSAYLATTTSLTIETKDDVHSNVWIRICIAVPF